MAEEASFTINLGLPMGLRLDGENRRKAWQVVVLKEAGSKGGCFCHRFFCRTFPSTLSLTRFSDDSLIQHHHFTPQFTTIHSFHLTLLSHQDDTLVVLSVEPGGQAEVAGVPPGSRVLAVGGETVTIVEDAIAALKRLRDAGNLDAVVVSSG
jgi:hypothetical protein